MNARAWVAEPQVSKGYSLAYLVVSMHTFNLNRTDSVSQLMFSMEQEHAKIRITGSVSHFPLCRTSFGLIFLFREPCFY